MKVNDIFLENEYTKYAKFANANNYKIVEIEKNNDNDRQFKLVENNDNKNFDLINEIEELKEWFDTYYARHEQKYRRLNTLSKMTDEGKNAYNALIELYNEAETKRLRIQELEGLVSDNSK